MARRRKDTKLPAPFLRRLTLIADRMGDRREYPMNLPWLEPETFELTFSQPVTIVVGENGTGKSTLIEAVAALAGYDEAGGDKGHRPVDHSRAFDTSGAGLADALRGGWLPKVTHGWFFKAESFFSVARYLDEAARDVGQPAPDFLSWSHGEGFLRVFSERMSRQGLYLMDEPESALSPHRQIDLLRILDRVQNSALSQVILATHSPMLMAVPGATVFQISRFGLQEIDYRETRHFRMLQSFTADPDGFVAEALSEEP